MILRVLCALSLAVVSAGCVSTNFTQARTPCLDAPGGWCPFTVDLAQDSWQYAQMAENAYERDEYYDMGSALPMRVRQDNNRAGLAYAIFDRFEHGAIVETIIAYRGTEFTHLNDWFYGNIGDTQRNQALDVYDEVRRTLDEGGYDAVPISVAGHSLGGALSLHVALRRDAEAYVFNSSPRFERPAEYGDARRVAVGERGEVLRSLRRFRDLPVHDGLVINCRAGARPASDHYMRALADCLTWIAAFESEEAYASLGQNGIDAPRVNAYCRREEDGSLTPLGHPGVNGRFEAGFIGCDDLTAPPAPASRERS